MTTPSNTPATTPAIPEASAEPFFGIQRIFLKGVSLEMPNGASTFLESAAPALSLNLQVHNVKLADTMFECAVRATLSAEVNGKPLFLLEVEQAGVFEARALSAEQAADVQEIAAPTILAPYLRAQLADVLTRATLPSFYMPEINWAVMAAQNRFAKAEAAAVQEKPAPSLVLH